MNRCSCLNTNRFILSSFFLLSLVFNLLAASYSDGSWDHKLRDEIGNLFKTKEKKDRKYGKAGQLLKDEKYSYTYDEVGNLIEKSSLTETWKYKWTQGGMLKKVIRPDKKHVDFAYDALGRRLTKTYKDQTTHFVWDGNVPLHEWTSGIDDAISQVNEDGEREIITPENLTTWIFEDRTFIPMAKMQGEKSYSIITDHLGTPTEAYDNDGKKVWSRQLSIYGETRKETGFENFVPFLYQGQYLDTETGLAYNRYRYYSPESGVYVSQDPIGLLGNNPNFYAYTSDNNSLADPLGLINFRGLSDDGLVDKLGEIAYRDKRIFGNSGTHGIVHRVREQITGAMRPPHRGWGTHQKQITDGLSNLREGLNQARMRGIMDKVLSKYPGINKVANLKPPKPSDTKVPRICKK